ncbi:MAG: aldehyde dehydrogenase family protein [Betaproteobacteria bacterium]
MTLPDDVARDPAIDALVARGRTAQRRFAAFDQHAVDDVVLAAAWAIMEPSRNRALAEMAVRDTGLGDVADKLAKNHRKTLGLLRDFKGAKSVGVIGEDAARGITEIARPAGLVAAITPSTNPAATPANNVLCALKGGNAIVVAPSPKGWSTGARLVEFINAELARVDAPADLVQIVPAPVTRAATQALMAAADLVVATGSQANVRSAYRSGTPAFGVGAGNVAVIVDASADVRAAGAKIAASKTFDNATSCSSENSVVALEAIAAPLRTALEAEGGVFLDADEKARLRDAMWRAGRLAAEITAQSAPRIATLAGLARPALQAARFLIVDEDGVGADHPFSGEKLSPVLAFYRAADFSAACALVERIYAYQGAGHSVGIHTRDDDQALALGLTLPVARVIVNQAHCFATGGSFDNGLAFSLSMGCGTWGRNNFSDNLNYRHYLNITRVARVIPERVPTEVEIFGAWFARHGR